MARKKKTKSKANQKHFELPLWLVIFMSFVFILTWFLMSQATFFVASSYVFWLIMTMAFLIPVMVVWLIYFKVIEL